METIDLRNSHKDEIIDLIGAKVKSIKQLNKNRDKILALINETTPIKAEQLESALKLVEPELPESVITVKDTKDFRSKIIKYIIYMLQDDVSNNYFDGGYAAIVIYYFYLSSKLIAQEQA